MKITPEIVAASSSADAFIDVTPAVLEEFEEAETKRRGYRIKVRGAAKYTVREYECDLCGVFAETVETPHPGSRPCPTCGRPSPLVVSAVAGRVKLGEVSRGKVADAPSPYALDTRPLAEGMPLAEFKQKRAKLWREKREREWKDKGL